MYPQHVQYCPWGRKESLQRVWYPPVSGAHTLPDYTATHDRHVALFIVIQSPRGFNTRDSYTSHNEDVDESQAAKTVIA